MTTAPPSQSLTAERISEIYGFSRANFYQLSGRHHIRRADWANPDIVLAKLLETGNSCELRTRLTHPAERARIAILLNSQPENSNS